jgi:hypothetical protein
VALAVFYKGVNQVIIWQVIIGPYICTFARFLVLMPLLDCFMVG